LRIFLKAITAILTVAVGVAMGIWMLDGFESEYWKIGIWSIACAGIGKFVFSILRAIDRRYKRN